MSDQTAADALKAAEAILAALPRTRKFQVLGSLNDLFLYLERKAREEAKR